MATPRWEKMGGGGGMSHTEQMVLTLNSCWKGVQVRSTSRHRGPTLPWWLQ